MHYCRVIGCHADSEYVSYVTADREAAEFIGGKQIHSLTHAHTDTQLYILVAKRTSAAL